MTIAVVSLVWLLYVEGLTSATGLAQNVKWTPENGVPVVRRGDTASRRPGDSASLCVLVRVVQKTTVERGDDSPDWPEAVRDYQESWEYAMAYVLDVPRVNERRPNEPDLKERFLLIDQRHRVADPIKFELGHIYLLFLSSTPELLAEWNLPSLPFRSPPRYEMPLVQGGLEVVGVRGRGLEDRLLRVLRRGGPLDVYDGRRLRAVLEEFSKD